MASVPNSDFFGHWVSIREVVTFGYSGCLNFKAVRMDNQQTILSYNGCGVQLGVAAGYYSRPKFGFYRSLVLNDLKD